MARLKTSDTVIVIAGKDKGKQGAVVKVLNDYVIVEGINKIKKHKKPNPQQEHQVDMDRVKL